MVDSWEAMSTSTGSYVAITTTNPAAPMIFHIVAQVKYAQSWTVLFRVFSSHRQPSAIFSKVFPAEETSWPNWQILLACREADA